MSKITNIITIVFITIGLLGVVITYLNAKMFNKLCETYKSNYGFLPSEKTTFDYFDFSIAYTKVISTSKIVYIYTPILFGRNRSWNKYDKTNWYEFINTYSISFKIGVLLEILLTFIGLFLIVWLVILKYFV